MRSIATLLLCTSISLGAAAQTTITNGGFENWDNPGASDEEPQSWNSNKTGSPIAQLADQTCFRDASIVHSGTYSVRMETINYLFISVVNGSLTTGVVNAPSTSKAEGYIGTTKYMDATDQRRMSFTGRPDSLVGWYRYTPGGASEQGKIRCILHNNDYYDPETPATDHPDPTADKIGEANWTTPLATVGTWTRFSVPFTYSAIGSPSYIMINATPSANQLTTVAGSKLWLDDLEVVYNPTTGCATPSGLAATGVTATAATLNWSSTGAAAAQYVMDGNASDPAGFGTNISGTSYNATGLTPNTTYYFHLRDTCAVGMHSPWTTTLFTTLHPVGVSNVTNGSFEMTTFPNPVSNEVTIKISGATAAGMLQLTDMSGRVISSVAANNNTVNMSTSGLAAGLYLIRYTDATHTQTIKISKQ